jgi:primase-polymerase (primpol)-like protein
MMSATQEARPTAPPVNPDNIPEELRRQDCWVCWRYERRNGRWAKPPVDGRTGERADVTNTQALLPFEEALAYSLELRLDGVGFVFTPDGPYSGVDLDKSRDPESGRFTPEAEEIIRAINSYGEVSPSLRGAKLFLRGKLPPDSRGKKGNVEMYSGSRYFTVTGLHIPWTPATVEDRQAALLGLYHRVFAPEPKAPRPQPAVAPATPEDAELLARTRGAKNGDKFSRLWAGDTEGYPSQSEAEIALCRLLAFWCGADEGRIERLANQSPLVQRDKWRDDEDYRKATIRKVLADQAAHYHPPKSAAGEVLPEAPNEAPDDPHRLARLYAEKHRRPGG